MPKKKYRQRVSVIVADQYALSLSVIMHATLPHTICHPPLYNFWREGVAQLSWKGPLKPAVSIEDVREKKRLARRARAQLQVLVGNVKLGKITVSLYNVLSDVSQPLDEKPILFLTTTLANIHARIVNRREDTRIEAGLQSLIVQCYPDSIKPVTLLSTKLLSTSHEAPLAKTSPAPREDETDFIATELAICDAKSPLYQDEFEGFATSISIQGKTIFLHVPQMATSSLLEAVIKFADGLAERQQAVVKVATLPPGSATAVASRISLAKSETTATLRFQFEFGLLHASLTDAMGEVGGFLLRGVEGGFQQDKDQLFKAAINDVEIVQRNATSPMAGSELYNRILSVVPGHKLIHITAKIPGSSEVDTSATPEVFLETASLQCVFLMKFVYRILAFSKPLQHVLASYKPSPNRLGIDDSVTTLEPQPKASFTGTQAVFRDYAGQLKLSCEIGAPVVIIPTFSTSPDAILLDFGHVSIKGDIEDLGATAVNTIAILLTDLKVMHVSTSLNAERLEFADQRPMMETAVTTAKVTLPVWSRSGTDAVAMAPIACKCVLGSVKLSLGRTDCTALFAILEGNMEEGKPAAETAHVEGGVRASRSGSVSSVISSGSEFAETTEACAPPTPGAALQLSIEWEAVGLDLYNDHDTPFAANKRDKSLRLLSAAMEGFHFDAEMNPYRDEATIANFSLRNIRISDSRLLRKPGLFPVLWDTSGKQLKQTVVDETEGAEVASDAARLTAQTPPKEVLIASIRQTSAGIVCTATEGFSFADSDTLSWFQSHGDLRRVLLSRTAAGESLAIISYNDVTSASHAMAAAADRPTQIKQMGWAKPEHTTARMELNRSYLVFAPDFVVEIANFIVGVMPVAEAEQLLVDDEGVAKEEVVRHVDRYELLSLKDPDKPHREFVVLHDYDFLGVEMQFNRVKVVVVEDQYDPHTKSLMLHLAMTAQAKKLDDVFVVMANVDNLVITSMNLGFNSTYLQVVPATSLSGLYRLKGNTVTCNLTSGGMDVNITDSDVIAMANVLQTLATIEMQPHIYKGPWSQAIRPCPKPSTTDAGKQARNMIVEPASESASINFPAINIVLIQVTARNLVPQLLFSFGLTADFSNWSSKLSGFAYIEVCCCSCYTFCSISFHLDEFVEPVDLATTR